MAKRTHRSPRIPHYRAWYHGVVSMMRTLLNGGQSPPEEEPHTRIVMAGLPGSGKSRLYNRLHGVEVSPVGAGGAGGREDLGLFLLVDLAEGTLSSSYPPAARGESWSEPASGPVFAREDAVHIGQDFASGTEGIDEATLLIFMVDGTAGMTQETYRWFWRLRGLGSPIILVWNLPGDVSTEAASYVRKLGAHLAVPAVALSAQSGVNVLARLVPLMTELVPSLILPLGREVAAFRPLAARRLIEETVLVSGVLGFEPVPLLDMPFQMVLEGRLVAQLAALYGRVMNAGGGMIRREFIATAVATSGVRYTAQQLAKLMPVIGAVASGVISIIGTFLIGWMAAAYFEYRTQGTGWGARLERIGSRMRQGWRIPYQGWCTWRQHRGYRSPRSAQQKPSGAEKQPTAALPPPKRAEEGNAKSNVITDRIP